MYLGKVMGSVVCTIKNDVLESKKLLLVRRLQIAVPRHLPRRSADGVVLAPFALGQWSF